MLSTHILASAVWILPIVLIVVHARIVLPLTSIALNGLVIDVLVLIGACDHHRISLHEAVRPIQVKFYFARVHPDFRISERLSVRLV